MPKDTKQADWKEYQIHVISELERNRESIDKLTERITEKFEKTDAKIAHNVTSIAKIKTEVKFKSGIWGGVAALVLFLGEYLASRFGVHK